MSQPIRQQSGISEVFSYPDTVAECHRVMFKLQYLLLCVDSTDPQDGEIARNLRRFDMYENGDDDPLRPVGGGPELSDAKMLDTGTAYLEVKRWRDRRQQGG